MATTDDLPVDQSLDITTIGETKATGKVAAGGQSLLYRVTEWEFDHRYEQSRSGMTIHLEAPPGIPSVIRCRGWLLSFTGGYLLQEFEHIVYRCSDTGTPDIAEFVFWLDTEDLDQAVDTVETLIHTIFEYGSDGLESQEMLASDYLTRQQAGETV